MGKITELSQGSLNGLRRQLNECIENAYNKGYAEALKLDEGTPTKDYTSGYNTALKDFENLYVYENDYKEFFLNVYANPFYENVTLFDAVAKYGIEKVMDDFKKWQEQKKQAEEEIKVGDEIEYLPTNQKGYFVGESPNYYKGIYPNPLNTHLPITIFEWSKQDCKKTGKHIEEVSQLLDKLKGDNK